MTQLVHNFEGGVDGTTLVGGAGNNTDTAGNNYFDGIDLPAGAIVQYSSSHSFEGHMSMRCATRATGGLCGAHWQGQLGTPGDQYIRFMFMVTEWPDVNIGAIAWFLNSALNIEVGTIRLLGTGALNILNTAETTVVDGTVPIPLYSWCRVEAFIHPSTTAAYITVRLYKDPYAAIGSFDEELNGGGSPTTWAMGAGTIDSGYQIYSASLSSANWPTATGFVHFDGIVAGASSWVGPPPRPTVPNLEVMYSPLGWR